MERCYNCGKELDNNSTKEHIPARALFDGYDEKYKTNRITVPACFDCNNKYSTTDEEFRNMIGIMAKHTENNAVTDNAVKSILRKDTEHKRLLVDSSMEVRGVTFSQQTIEDFHKKNFMGLFYHQYGYPLPANYKLVVDICENGRSEFAQHMIDYLNNLFEKKVSGHEDILSYCLQPVREKITNPDKKDLPLNKDENIIACMLTYNQEHTALVYAIREERYEQIEQRHKQATDKPKEE